MEPASAVARALREAPLEGLEALIEASSDDPRATVASAVARARRRLERERADRERVAGLYRTMDGLAEGGLAVVNTLLFGGTAPFFWFEVVCGLVIPFCLLVFAKNRRNMKIVGVAAVLVVAGVFCNRCWLMFTGFAMPNIVGGPGITLGTTAAQTGGAADMWSIMGVYAPTVPEVVLTVGIFALGVCAFTVLCQLLLRK